MSSPSDFETMLIAVLQARKLAAQPAFRDYLSDEIEPSPEKMSDSELCDWIRTPAISGSHWLGTDRMGGTMQRWSTLNFACEV